MLDLAGRDPVVNVFVDYRARITQLEPRWIGGEMWGFLDGGELVSACHSGANLVPVQATSDALAVFAERAVQQGRRCATIGGPVDAVSGLWRYLSPAWGPARDERWNQPHLEIADAPLVAPEPMVRRTRREDLDVVYPACVAMYTEELGVSPEEGGGRDLYRARVAQLISKGWSFALIEHGRVTFKAEVAAVTPSACQVQGVYVPPDRRGEGLAERGLAAVVATALREIAPVVSLYVNEHNVPARRAYDRVGFRQTATFATVMF